MSLEFISDKPIYKVFKTMLQSNNINHMISANSYSKNMKHQQSTLIYTLEKIGEGTNLVYLVNNLL